MDPLGAAGLVGDLQPDGQGIVDGFVPEELPLEGGAQLEAVDQGDQGPEVLETG